MKNYFVTAAYFILLFALSSCGKGNNEPDSGGNFISTIHETIECNNCTTSGQQSTEIYKYNSNKQLVSIISPGDSSIFQYNSEGQLANIYQSNSAGGPISNSFFVYDTQGRIAKMIGMPLLPNLMINDLSFSYDANNRVIADSTHNRNTAEIIAFRVYEYDNSGNINKISYFHIFNGTTQKTDEWNITYNDKINPYYAIKNVIFYLFNDPTVISKNIVVSTPNYDHYTYFSNGLPRQLVQTSSQPGNVRTDDYSYIP